MGIYLLYGVCGGGGSGSGGGVSCAIIHAIEEIQQTSTGPTISRTELYCRRSHAEKREKEVRSR